MKESTNPVIIENCIKLTIADLKRMELFQPDAFVFSRISWGSSFHAIVLINDDQSILTIRYSIRGVERTSMIGIETRPANIGKGVIRYFVCPVTNRLCRNLYLYNGRFVSQKAMRFAMYKQQTRSKINRMIPEGVLADDYVPYKPYGKMYYRGKLTPYGKRIMRYEQTVENSAAAIMLNVFHAIHRPE